MSIKNHLININIKIYYIYMLLSFKFSYIPYHIEKIFFGLVKFIYMFAPI